MRGPQTVVAQWSGKQFLVPTCVRCETQYDIEPALCTGPRDDGPGADYTPTQCLSERFTLREDKRPITHFTGIYRFLSNFAPVPSGLVYGGRMFPTVENAYQSSKAPFTRWSSYQHMFPSEAKRKGRQETLPEDWDARKAEIMKRLLQIKFQDSELRRQLLATQGRHLEEGNAWGDTYWGVCEGKGENVLGYLLMSERARIRAERNLPSLNTAILGFYVAVTYDPCHDEWKACVDKRVGNRAIDFMVSGSLKHVLQALEQHLEDLSTFQRHGLA